MDYVPWIYVSLMFAAIMVHIVGAGRSAKGSFSWRGSYQQVDSMAEIWDSVRRLTGIIAKGSRQHGNTFDMRRYRQLKERLNLRR